MPFPIGILSAGHVATGAKVRVGIVFTIQKIFGLEHKGISHFWHLLCIRTFTVKTLTVWVLHLLNEYEGTYSIY